MEIYDVPVVFFDLDHSLINQDTNSLWIRWRLGRERWAVVEGALALASLYRDYKKGTVTHARLSQYYRIRTRGMTLSDYQALASQFLADRGQLHIYPQAASLLFAYRRQNTQVVMITGADEVLAEAYGKELGMDSVISNRLNIEGERIAGLEEPLCYGEGKVERARAYTDKLGVSLNDCAFYTDSHADLPLLEQIGFPVVLNPNLQLQQEALERGWPCLDWRITL